LRKLRAASGAWHVARWWCDVGGFAVYDFATTPQPFRSSLFCRASIKARLAILSEYAKSLYLGIIADRLRYEMNLTVRKAPKNSA